MFYFEKENMKMSNVYLPHCHCDFVLSAKRGFLYGNFQLGPDKVSVVKRCPLHRDFLIRILYETNPFLKSVR